MAKRKEPHAYQNPIYEAPPETEYDLPRYHRSTVDTVGAHSFVGSGAAAIGERNHIKCSSRPKESGALEDNLRSALSPFFGKQ